MLFSDYDTRNQMAPSLRHAHRHAPRYEKSHGIYTRTELHATDWLGGRGNVAPKTVPRIERMKLFDKSLNVIAALPDVAIFNAFGTHGVEEKLFQYLIQRIQNTVNHRRRNPADL